MWKGSGEHCSGVLRRLELRQQGGKDQSLECKQQGFPMPQVLCQFHLKYFLMKSEWP